MGGEKHRSTTLLSTSAQDVPERRGQARANCISAAIAGGGKRKPQGCVVFHIHFWLYEERGGAGRMAISSGSRQQLIDDAAWVVLLRLSPRFTASCR